MKSSFRVRHTTGSPLSIPTPNGDLEAATLYEAMQATLLATPALATAGNDLTIGSNYCGKYDYYRINAPSGQVLSSWASGFWFTETRNRCALVTIDGDLTINSGITVTPSQQKHFVALYVTGNIVLNGQLSMTARGASHGTASIDNANKVYDGSGFYNANTQQYEIVGYSGNDQCLPWGFNVGQRAHPDNQVITDGGKYDGSGVSATDIPIAKGKYLFSTMGSGGVVASGFNQAGPTAEYLDPTISASGGTGGALITATRGQIIPGNHGQSLSGVTASNGVGVSGTLLAKTGGGGGGPAFSAESDVAWGGAGGNGTCFTGGTGGGGTLHQIWSRNTPEFKQYISGSPNGMAGGRGRNFDQQSGGIGSPTLQEYRSQTGGVGYTCETSNLGRGQGGVLVVFCDGTITGNGGFSARGVGHAGRERHQYQTDGLWGGLSGGSTGGGIVMTFCSNGSTLPQDTTGGICVPFLRRQVEGGDGGTGSSYAFQW